MWRRNAINGCERSRPHNNRTVLVVKLTITTRRSSQTVGRQLCFCPQLIKRFQVAKAIFMYRLVDDRDTIGLGEQNGKRLLPVSCKTGVDVRLDYRGAQFLLTEEANGICIDQVKTSSHLPEVGEEIAERLRADALNSNIAIRCTGQAGPRGGLNAIPHHFHIRAGQLFHTLDANPSPRKGENDCTHCPPPLDYPKHLFPHTTLAHLL